VSDTTLRDPQIRRTVLANAILALVFGVVIVAGTVGLISGLFRRSASDNTSGSNLVSPMPPADRGPWAPSPPSRNLRRNATHVAIREYKTGTLA
jgi:hypothetical protein